ncbi:MAG TPA: hypothetical protein VJ252_00135 [Chthoniobacterales bacterium]|jgi:hypothetical protein|nr:hypothetical protein [Chthoniobacterales bacterium]
MNQLFSDVGALLRLPWPPGTACLRIKPLKAYNPDIEQQNTTQELDASGSEAKKHSGIGIASFAISLGAGLGIFLVFVIAGIMETTTPGGMNEKSASAIIVGFSIIGLLFANLVAIGLGLGGLMKKGKKKLFAVLGTVFSSVITLGTIVLIAIGLIMKNR